MASKFVVLTYHRVLDDPDPLHPAVCHRDRFAGQLRWLRRGFNVVPLAEAVQRAQDGSLPARAVCITFDDGYRDNHDNALPMLQAAGLPATFFVATGYLNDGVMWNDQVFEAVRRRPAGDWDLTGIGLGLRRVDGLDGRRRLAQEIIVHLKHQHPDRRADSARAVYEQGGGGLDRIMMTDAEVRALADAGMAIGGHTVTHPILTSLDDERARQEIADGRRALQDIAGQAVTLFAYPNGKPGGDYDARHARMASEAGFEAAFSTQWGYAGPGAPPFEQPRVGLEYERGWRFAAKLAKAFFEPPQAV